MEYDRYTGQFPLPPPLNLISYFIKILQWVFGKIKRARISETKTELVAYEFIYGIIN